MKEPLKIIKNTMFLMSGAVLDNIIGFFLIIVISRFLGDVGLGQYSFAFSFVAMFMLIGEFGVDTYIFKEISKYPNKKRDLLSLSVSFRICSSFILLLVFAPLLFYITKGEGHMTILIMLCGLSLVFNTLRYSLGVLFLALERAEVYVGSMIIERVLSLVLAILLTPKCGLIGLFTGFAVAYSLSFLVIYVVVVRNYSLNLRFRIDVKHMKSILRKSAPFWFTSIFSFIYFRLDTLMLGYLKTYEVVGRYNAAYSLILGLTFVPAAFTTATFPVMNRYFKKGQTTLLKNLNSHLVYYMVILGLPIVVGTTLLADRIILFVFKEAFLPAALALRILIWSAVFHFINTVLGNLMNSIDQQKKFTLTTGFAALVNILLNFALIPTYSYVGAAIATVITFFLSLVLLWRYSTSFGFGVPLLRSTVRPVIASLGMGVIVWLLLNYHLLIICPIAVVAYFGILFILGGLRKKEIDIMRMVTAELRKKFTKTH